MKKRLVKVILTAAMVATMFIGGGSAAKAGFDEDMNQFCKLKGCTEDDVLYNDALFEEFDRWSFSINNPRLDYDEALAETLKEFEAMYGPLGAESNNIYATVADLHKDMLKKVNADRKDNGAGSLVWDTDLEAVAQQRAVEVMSNVQTVEFKQAYDSGDMAKIDEIVHTGYTLKENAIVSFSTGISSKRANDNWIASAGHHRQRIKAGFKSFALVKGYSKVVNWNIPFIMVYSILYFIRKNKLSVLSSS